MNNEEFNEDAELNNYDPELDHNSLESTEAETIKKVSGMYEEWFLDYASYVILERAVPAIEDGFKPVQRRIMHSMKELDDGRYNKVANIVGHTMQYHPHGDASIGDAMVQIGQKDLLIDTQGNWGNILTGDDAAASRYIEARLSKFALDVLYSPKITPWQLSYDGRRNEPINLPAKFPILLAQGGEGIAVGLSTKILPHNFIELIDASIKILKKKPFVLYPDFPTAGIADISNYNDGARGGRVRVRARISQVDKTTLVIKEIPFSTTTTSLIDSILKANEKGKIKIKKVEDNTSSEVEIAIHLPPGVSPDKTIDALYAFTSCEVSIAPLGCVIQNNKPLFTGVSEMLKQSTERTVDLLKQELIIELGELEEQWHFSSLERIFIENRIYRNIEEEETWDGVIAAIDEGLKPFTSHLKRAVTTEDIVRLTEIRIKRISRFDLDKAQEKLDALEGDIEKVKYNIEHIIDFTISFFTNLKEKYGKGRERKTELRNFDNIEATKVVLRNQKLYVNREEGFIGTALRKDEYIADCSDIDDVIVFLRDGSMTVSKIEEKKFVGKDIIHAAVFNKNDKRTIYNMIYRDGKTGSSFVKRFSVSSITRDKVYDLTQEKPGSQVLYFSSNPNGEAEVVTILLRQLSNVKKLKFDLDFADLLIKGRTSKGNIVTKYPIKKIELKEKGISTLRPRKIWFDDTVHRLNVDGRGELLGEFKPEDRLLIITQSGKLKTIIPELTTHFDDDIIVLEKWIPTKPISCIYFDPEKDKYFGKRFLVESVNKEELFISEHPYARLEIVSTDYRPMAEIIFAKSKGVEKEPLIINFEEFIAVKGIKAQGNQVTSDKVKMMNLLESLPYEEVLEEETSEKNNFTDTVDESSLTIEEDGQIGFNLE
ncbi:DNA gyrase/topoisomerase IV subunit A [Flavobacterium sp. CBA20B-1]|uniref:DNA gyrase/topoisomerase IV subunit A n=1 Tax=unclassified Flavobacterium TaxID=196869 RepID=UPI002224A656|nr:MULTISPECIES: DNA gyrase/topoisomerase IV subunit A [unclassified Flavobacterium]WCM42185.1 DNA gyrase/topoisomerase IV subunit A [Flavobacterium sp. CBA20B-1]